MTVELIAAVLAQHRVGIDHIRRFGRWMWWCSCFDQSEAVYDDASGAEGAGARHQAEQVTEALAHGTPEAKETAA